MCSISSRTNSPAAVDARLPCERSRFAFLTVLSVGMKKNCDRGKLRQVASASLTRPRTNTHQGDHV